MDTIRMKKMRPEAKLPARATAGSAGYDLCAALTASETIAPGETKLIPTGIAMAIPAGYGGFVFARSGLGIRHGIAPANAVGVIDSDYRGEVLVGLRNYSQVPFVVEPGERVAQLVLMPVCSPEAEECDSLDETDRGEGGFGSTGRKDL